MRMMDGSRGWLWTAVLLLAALSTCLAADNSDGSVPLTNTSKSEPDTTVESPNTTLAATTTKASTPKNATTAPAPKTSPSSSPAKPSTAAPPPPTSPTTKGPTPPPSTTTSTTVTSKGTLKPPETSPTKGSSTTVSPVTGTMSSGTQKITGFDLGSFIGGIVLTLSILAIAYFGCRFYNSRRGVRYRTIDEHEAII